MCCFANCLSCFPRGPLPQGRHGLRNTDRTLKTSELQAGVTAIANVASRVAPSFRFIGGTALAIMGSPRKTDDFDIVVRTEREKQALIQALSRDTTHFFASTSAGVIRWRNEYADWTICLHTLEEDAFRNFWGVSSMPFGPNGQTVPIMNPHHLVSAKQLSSSSHTRRPHKVLTDKADLKWLREKYLPNHNIHRP